MIVRQPSQRGPTVCSLILFTFGATALFCTSHIGLADDGDPQPVQIQIPDGIRLPALSHEPANETIKKTFSHSILTPLVFYATVASEERLPASDHDTVWYAKTLGW